MGQWPSFGYEVNDDNDDDNDNGTGDPNSIARLITGHKIIFQLFLFFLFYHNEGRVNSENTKTNKLNRTKAIPIKKSMKISK